MSNVLSALGGDIFSQGVESIIKALQPLIDATKAVVQFILNQVSNIIATGIDFIDEQLDAIAPVTPENARTQLPKILAAAFLTVSGLYLLSMAVDAIPFLRGSTILDLAQLANKLVGVEAMIAAFTGAALGASMATPLEHYFNAKFRPNEYSEEQAIKLAYRGLLDFSDLPDIFKNHGWSDEKVSTLIKGSNNLIGASDLFRLSRLITLSPQFVAQRLSQDGIVGIDNQYYQLAIAKAPVRDELTRFEGDILQEYKNGFITDERFNDLLNYAVLSQDEITATKNNAGIELEIELIKEKIALLQAAFRQGFLDQPTLREYLKNLGLREEKVNNIWLGELIRAGIQPAELLLFPTIQAFVPTSFPWSVSIQPA